MIRENEKQNKTKNTKNLNAKEIKSGFLEDLRKIKRQKKSLENSGVRQETEVTRSMCKFATVLVILKEMYVSLYTKFKKFLKSVQDEGRLFRLFTEEINSETHQGTNKFQTKGLYVEFSKIFFMQGSGGGHL